MLTDNLRNTDGSLMLMDPSISIPNNLVLRSLPINVELLELLRGERDCGEPNQCNGRLRGLFHLVLEGSEKEQSPATNKLIDLAEKEVNDKVNEQRQEVNTFDEISPFKSLFDPQLEKSISEVEALYPVNKRD